MVYGLHSGPSCHVAHWVKGQGSTYYSTISIKFIFFLGAFHEVTESKRDNVRFTSSRTCHNNAINNNSKWGGQQVILEF